MLSYRAGYDSGRDAVSDLIEGDEMRRQLIISCAP
jgi:hypothetical protein